MSTSGAEKSRGKPGTKSTVIAARGVIVLDAYRIISCAIDGAIPVGIERAHKHLYGGQPDRDYLAECIHTAIMDALAECIDWDRS